MRVGVARAALILAAFLAAAVALMPVQWLLCRLGARGRRTLPRAFHRGVCRLIGVRVTVHGALAGEAGRLLVANHVSWLDIPVLSAVAPVSFVAKAEVARWGMVGTLARLQRTVFVDRTRRAAASPAVTQIAGRLARGDTIVLFAEGTSSGGARALAFRSTLLGAVVAEPGRGASAPPPVRPVAIVYRALNGLPVGRPERPRIGFFGDMDMQRHAWALLKAGPIDVDVYIGPELAGASGLDRKALASACERWVGDTVVAANRGRAPAVAGIAVPPTRTATRRASGDGWR